MDPLYEPNAVLGWAETRIEEKFNRGMVAHADGGRQSLPRLAICSRATRGHVAFNVYRSTAGGEPVKLNEQSPRQDDRFLR